MVHSRNSRRHRDRHPRGRNKGRGLSARRDKVARESRQRRQWAWRDENRSAHVDTSTSNKKRQRRRSQTPSSCPSPIRRSSASKKTNRSQARARAKRSKERSGSESSEVSIDIIRPLRPCRQEPPLPNDVTAVGGSETQELDGSRNAQESSVLDKGVTSRSTEDPIDSPSSPNPASEELYARALRAHGIPERALIYPDGFQRMSLTFAGRISIVKDYSDSTCRKIAMRMIQKWQQTNETYLSLSTRYLTNRKKEPEPDSNNNNQYGYDSLKTFPPMMKLRHELHDILASRPYVVMDAVQSRQGDLTGPLYPMETSDRLYSYLDPELEEQEAHGNKFTEDQTRSSDERRTWCD